MLDQVVAQFQAGMVGGYVDAHGDPSSVRERIRLQAY
jgi:hypothetical protein